MTLFDREGLDRGQRCHRRPSPHRAQARRRQARGVARWRLGAAPAPAPAWRAMMARAARYVATATLLKRSARPGRLRLGRTRGAAQARLGPAQSVTITAPNVREELILRLSAAVLLAPAPARAA